MRAKSAHLQVEWDNKALLLIDGVEFPYDILWDRLSVDSQTSTVTVTIPVERVSVELIQNPEPVQPDLRDAWAVGTEFDPSEEPPEFVTQVGVEHPDLNNLPSLRRSGTEWYLLSGPLPWKSWVKTFESYGGSATYTVEKQKGSW